MNLYYRLAGSETIACDMMTWATAFEHTNRQLARDRATRHATVSTVFLGLDHNWNPAGPPLLFESMVFGGPLDQEMFRYSSWEQAIAGHAAMLRMARKARYYRAPMKRQSRQQLRAAIKQLSKEK